MHTERFIARFAKDKRDHFEVITVFSSHTDRQTVSKENPSIQTLAKIYPSAVWFERKISDDFGIVIENTFDKRPLVSHERFDFSVHPMCKDFRQKSMDESDYTPYKYEEIQGDGVFQVAVGPIHAGIIEPGHFHFSQAGEGILHLEVRHFYKYRAIEKMLEGKTLQDAGVIIERISGTESIAYQIALRDILIQASNTLLPLTLRKCHAFLLELERVIHHLNDLGHIPNDAGFASALAFASKLCEDARVLLQKISGHRFGFGAIRCSSQHFDTAYINIWIDQMQKDIAFFEDWIIDIPSLWDRFDTTGVLKQIKCIKYDVVGVMAKASGICHDRRESDFYRSHGFIPALESSCDVAARFKVRIKEVKNSLQMMRNFLEEDCQSITYGTVNDGEYEAFCESALGELFMYIEIKDEKINRFFVRDPSFINWQALHLMMQGNIIADFPLINKSCDLSYAGSDL